SASPYIQVTGRIGRRWSERPGFVATLLNPGRPRDRSHYEQFRSYHERLYAQVEPTSVTPFSAPAVERGLHGAFASVVRQSGDAMAAERPVDVPDAIIREFARSAMERVAQVDPEEAGVVSQTLARRMAELQRWKKTRWGR